MMHPAVFLDRDNTIIHNDGDLGDPGQVRLIQGAAPAIASLCGLGYKIVVVTNQGGVARGKYTEEDVHAVHERIRELVTRAANGARIDAFYYCPYHPEGTVEKYRKEHPTRKPQPGMLKQAARELKLELPRSWMIGDQMRDVQAGQAASCRTVLLRPDAEWIAPGEPVELPDESDEPDEADDVDEVEPDVIARNLIEAVRVIAQHRKPEVAEEIARPATSNNKRWDAAAVAKLQRSDAEGEPASPEAGTSDQGEREEQKEQKEQDKPRPEEGNVGEQKSAQASPPPAASPPERRKPQPFRPVGAPPPADEQEDEPIVSRQRRSSRAPADETVADDSAVEPAPVQGDATDSTPSQHDEGRSSTQELHEPHEPNDTSSSTPVEDDATELKTSDDAGKDETPVQRTLRLILQELRHQRGMHPDDFAYSKTIAIVLQTVAAVCLLGALWMGTGDTDLFLRWMGAAVIFQGATISTLLFGRS